MRSNINTYFKRFRQESQKKEMELFSSSKYYNRRVFEDADFLIEYTKHNVNLRQVRGILTVPNLEEEIKLFCPKCCSKEYKELCFDNIVASLQTNNDVGLLKKLYSKSACSVAVEMLSQDFADFGVP